MKPSSSNNTRLYSVLAAALFAALAAYTLIHNSHDWSQAIIWAAIGTVFFVFGLARKPS